MVQALPTLWHGIVSYCYLLTLYLFCGMAWRMCYFCGFSVYAIDLRCSLCIAEPARLCGYCGFWALSIDFS